MPTKAERRSDSEVLGPRCRETLGSVDRMMAFGEVEVRVRMRTESFGFAARAGTF